MGELFLRKVVLEVHPDAGSGKKIEDLRIKFSIEKTNESTPNKAEIEIYNLAESTRNYLEAKNTRVSLSIGYLGLTPEGIFGSGFASSNSTELVVVGDVTKTVQEIDKTDIITKIEVADGGNRYRNARLEKGYPPNTKLTIAIDDLIKALGLSKGAKQQIPDKNYANGLTLSGLVRDHLNELCKANDLEWSIQNEAVQIIKKDQGLLNSIILLEPDSGLIGSPNKTKKGVEFTSLIQPQLIPGKRVQLKSRFISGIFKLRKVNHEGDSQTGTFLTKCEATK